MVTAAVVYDVILTLTAKRLSFLVVFYDYKQQEQAAYIHTKHVLLHLSLALVPPLYVSFPSTPNILSYSSLPIIPTACHCSLILAYMHSHGLAFFIFVPCRTEAVKKELKRSRREIEAVRSLSGILYSAIEKFSTLWT